MQTRANTAVRVSEADGDGCPADRWEAYAATRRTVIAVAAHIVGDTATAEDIAQEAFERLARQTTPVTNEAAWLRTVAYREAINELRRRERQQRAYRRSTSGAPPPPTPDELVDAGDRRVASAVAQLPARQKAAALLCWGDGLSMSETASAMGCTTATVRVHLFRARHTLRSTLSDLRPTHLVERTTP